MAEAKQGPHQLPHTSLDPVSCAPESLVPACHCDTPDRDAPQRRQNLTHKPHLKVRSLDLRAWGRVDRAGCPALDPSTWQRAKCLRHYLDVEQCVSPLWDTRPQVPLSAYHSHLHASHLSPWDPRAGPPMPSSPPHRVYAHFICRRAGWPSERRMPVRLSRAMVLVPPTQLLPDVGKGFARAMWYLTPQAEAVRTL